MKSSSPISMLPPVAIMKFTGSSIPLRLRLQTDNIPHTEDVCHIYVTICSAYVLFGILNQALEWINVLHVMENDKVDFYTNNKKSVQDPINFEVACVKVWTLIMNIARRWRRRIDSIRK